MVDGLDEDEVSFCQCCGYQLPFNPDSPEECRVCRWWLGDGWVLDADHVHYSGLTLREAQRCLGEIGFAEEMYSEFVRKGNDVVAAAGRLGVEQDSRFIAYRLPYDGDNGEVSALPFVNYSCSCCGFVTISGGMQRCKVCWWMAGVDDYLIGCKRINGVALSVARHNYKQHGAKWPRLVEVFGSASTDGLERVSRRRIDAERLGSIVLCPSHGGIQVLAKATCPCCGFHTIVANAEGDCVVCGWKFYRGHRDPTDHSKANPVTIGEAQKCFKAFGVCIPEYLQLKGRGLLEVPPEELRDIEWSPIE
jgi:hypothetical protein